MKVVITNNLSVEIQRDDGWYVYDIDLEECDSSAQLLDYLFQVFGKSWCTPQLIADVMRALNKVCLDRFGLPVQGVFCSFGYDSKVDWINNTTQRL
jgi:hypothetical protein